MSDPLPAVSDDDSYYWDEKWPELDTALEGDTPWWDREVDHRLDTR